MVNIFVYHAQDREGRVLAALLRACDKSQQFDFLPVETAKSIEHMHRFLQQNKLDPRTTTLPFIVLVADTEAEGTKRSVLQGDGLHQWLTSLVDAFLGAVCRMR